MRRPYQEARSDFPESDSANEMLISKMPNWLKSSLGGFYKIYFKLLKTHGPTHSRQFIDSPAGRMPAIDNRDLDRMVLDLWATRVGAAYRGIGILVEILGGAIILCALLPVGITLSTISETIVGVMKVVLMTSVAAILFTTRKLELKERFVHLSRAAEYKRYEPLIEQHGEVVLLPSGLREQFPVDISSASAGDRFLVLSRKLLERLESADESWLGIASHQKLYPV
jgi:hypothetical protein